MQNPFSLAQVTFGDAPASFFVAVTMQGGVPTEVLGAGRGLSRATAEASCLGEAIERTVAARMPPMGNPGEIATATGRIGANEIWQFSARQLRDGPHPGEPMPATHWAGVQSLTAGCTDWVASRTVGDKIGATYAVPRKLAWHAQDALPGDSNGLAAGRTRGEAERAALLELVERDAVAVWWYNRCPRPPHPLPIIDAAGGEALRHWLERRSRQTHLLDLTHDLRIPVVAAVSAEADGGHPAYAFAARMAPAEAAVSAVLEMLQIELSLRFAAGRAALVQGPAGPAGRFLDWSRAASLHRLPHLRPGAAAPRVAPEDIGADPIAIVDRLGPHPLLFVDLDQPDDPLRVVRAIVPGLRSLYPRFAPGRLASVPVALGWPHTPCDEATFAADDVILV